MTERFKPLSETLQNIRYLFTDVDDTLTTQGALLPATLQALYDLRDAGITVVPVTGACAGWCDHMLRLWPVDAVIGENGAFVMSLNADQSVKTDYWEAPVTMQAQQAKVKQIVDDYRLEHPAIYYSADQAYRLCDVAVDIAQSNQTVSDHDVQNLLAYLHGKGVNARQSSIHINAWLGDFDKFTMVKRLLTQRYGVTTAMINTRVAYIGDAPNDEPMFEALRHTFGVANIQRHLATMTHHPAYVLTQPGGLGFSECAQLLLSAG